MKTKRSNKINIVSLGCSKNLVDSELLMSQIKAGGYELVHNSNDLDAGTVIINTCGFIDDAKEESINTILRFIKARENKQIDRVFVMGCLSERYKDKLEKEIPEVDKYFRLGDTKNLLSILGVNYKDELIGSREITTPGHYAYLKISEGCDRYCSFCAIPLIRGKHRSKPINMLLTEARNLANKGVKEIILIAQDTTYYGRDIYKKPAIAGLIEKLSDINGIEWIRIHYTYPAGFPEDLVAIIKNNSKVCNYIDLPIQHINDKLLRSMRRGINRKSTIKLLDYLRSEIPDLSLRTTLLVGHPGETKEAFSELEEFVKYMRFDRLGVFPYSHEEDTWSYKNFDDKIPEEVKRSRAEEILSIQANISYELNQEKIGKEFDVIIDRKENNFYIGRTKYDSPDVDNEVLIPDKSIELRTGYIYKMLISSADEFDLYASLI